MNHANLCKILRDRCGTKWEQAFDSERLNIHETVSIEIPRLLPQPMIHDLHLKLEANRTYLHKPPVPRHEWLLAGRIFCARCGYCMFGQINPSGHRYYRHAHTPRVRACPLRPRPWIRADAIEEEVLSHLFDLRGNPALIEKAIKAAIPANQEEIEHLARLKAELDKIATARRRILNLIERDALTDEQAEDKLNDLNDREQKLRSKLDKIEVTLGNVPDDEAIRVFVEELTNGTILVYNQYGEMVPGGNDLGTWINMTTEDKKRLIDTVFNAPLLGGKPAGVYITRTAGTYHGPKSYSYQLRGHLIGGERGPKGRVKPSPSYLQAPSLPARRSCARPPRPSG
jgi:hypothetical protein